MKDRQSFSSVVVVVSLLAVMSDTRVQGQGMDAERKKLDDAKAAGALYYTHQLSIQQLFGQSSDAKTIDPLERDYYKALIQATKNRGLIPIATISTWVLPSFADAPFRPGSGKLVDGLPTPSVNCIPATGGTEYVRLMDIRNEMFATLAAQFPEIDLWAVGNEANWDFYDCAGERLVLEDQIKLIADTLHGAKPAIKKGNPNAAVIAHFLGRSDIPLPVRSREVQPRELRSHMLLEIQKRGHLPKDYFDALVEDFDAQLAADRQTASSSSLLPGNLWSTTSATPTPGWNVKWIDFFDTPTSDLVADTTWERRFETPPLCRL